MSVLLEASQLRWSIAGKTVVNHVSVQLRDGECLGVIGPNGCGKSSLLRMLYRILTMRHAQLLVQVADMRFDGGRRHR